MPALSITQDVHSQGFLLEHIDLKATTAVQRTPFPVSKDDRDGHTAAKG